MGKLSEKIKKTGDFLRFGLWEIDAEDFSHLRNLLLRGSQVAVLAVRDFFADGCLLRASALTYTTLLAIVPLLALAFSILKGFGVQNALEPIILERIGIGSEEIVTQMLSYIENTKVARLGTVGLVLLVVTVLTLVTNIERSFNHIWRVEETRPLFRRFADYFSLLTVGPIFLLAAISMTTTLESTRFISTLLEYPVLGHAIFLAFKVLPFVVMWLAFTFLYLFVPNTRIQIRPALAGGVFAGTLWQLAQWAYVTFQFGVSRYNAIYGTMAALPILMVWLYLSWLIVLLGVEVTYSVQNLRTIRREIYGEKVNFATREMAALTILLRLSQAFYRGQKPRTLEEIAEELALPPRLTRSILDELVRLSLLCEVVLSAEDGSAYQPARDPAKIEVHRVIRDLRQEGIGFANPRRTREWKVVGELEERIEGEGRESLGGLTLQDLAGQLKEEPSEGGGNAGQ